MKAPRFSAPLWVGLVLAAGAAAAQETVSYRVLPGDSLYRIAQTQLEDPRQWRAVARLNRLRQPDRLQPGQQLLLPVALMRGSPVSAAVAYVRGGVTLDGRAVAIGDLVGEADMLRVPALGFVSLQLRDGSLLQLQANSVARVVRLRELPQAGKGEGARNTLIQLDQGRLDLRVTPQPRGSQFRVKTPLSVAGVRGTGFGVATGNASGCVTADVIEGQVGVSSLAQGGAAGASSTLPVSMGQGALVCAGQLPQLRPLPPLPDLPPALDAAGGPIEALPAAVPWALPPGVAALRFELAEDEAFTRVLQVEQGTVLHLAEALADGRYALRVRAVDDVGLLGPERTLSLRIKARPVAPLAQQPRQHELRSPGVQVFRCTEVPGASGYRLQVGDQAGFGAVLVAQDAPRCSFELTQLPHAVLHWRVAALAPDEDGRLERGPYSDVRSFEIRALPSPPQAEDLVVSAAGVHWAGLPGLRYRVQIAREARFEKPVLDVELTEPRLSLETLNECEPVYLRIGAIDAMGRPSEFGAPRKVGAQAQWCASDGRPVHVGSGGTLESARP